MKTKIQTTDKYWIRNTRTGQIKTFNTFYALLNFLRTIQIKDLSAWSGWRHDVGYTKYNKYYQTERMY